MSRPLERIWDREKTNYFCLGFNTLLHESGPAFDKELNQLKLLIDLRRVMSPKLDPAFGYERI